MKAALVTALVGLLVLAAPVWAQAQNQRAQVPEPLRQQLQKASVFLKFTCEERVLADPEGSDSGQVVRETRGPEYATGVFISREGHILTAAHTLDRFLEPKTRSGVTLGCTEADITILGYAIDEDGIATAVEGGPRDNVFRFVEIYDDLRRYDVLILRSNSGGVWRPSDEYLCVGRKLSRDDFEELEVAIAGVGINPGVGNKSDVAEWEAHVGLTLSEKGSKGAAENFHRMTLPASPGMSGGPMVTLDGSLVGFTQGFGRALHPMAIRNHFVPQYLFHSAVAALEGECRPAWDVTFDQSIVFVDDKGRPTKVDGLVMLIWYSGLERQPIEQDFSVSIRGIPEIENVGLRTEVELYSETHEIIGRSQFRLGEEVPRVIVRPRQVKKPATVRIRARRTCLEFTFSYLPESFFIDRIDLTILKGEGPFGETGNKAAGVYSKTVNDLISPAHLVGAKKEIEIPLGIRAERESDAFYVNYCPTLASPGTRGAITVTPTFIGPDGDPIASLRTVTEEDHSLEEGIRMELERPQEQRVTHVDMFTKVLEP